jgi:hypothetical protein
VAPPLVISPIFIRPVPIIQVVQVVQILSVLRSIEAPIVVSPTLRTRVGINLSARLNTLDPRIRARVVSRRESSGPGLLRPGTAHIDPPPSPVLHRPVVHSPRPVREEGIAVLPPEGENDSPKHGIRINRNRGR